jgi:hypothetical protein
MSEVRILLGAPKKRGGQANSLIPFIYESFILGVERHGIVDNHPFKE